MVLDESKHVPVVLDKYTLSQDMYNLNHNLSEGHTYCVSKHINVLFVRNLLNTY